MTFRIYNDPYAYERDAGPLLARNMIDNNLIFKNIELAKAADDPQEILMTLVLDGETPLLAAAKAPGHAVVPYIKDHAVDMEVIKVFMDGAAANNIDITQIQAESATALAMAEASGKPLRLTHKLVLYVLEELIEPKLPPGHFRAANAGDMAFLPYWMGDFAPACRLGEFDLAGGIIAAQKYTENGRCYLWEDGIPVTMALNSRNVPGYKMVNQVYTPPHFQNKGYASACVAGLSRMFLAGGDKAALYANAYNPVSNHLYQKLGYKAESYMDTYNIVSS